MIDAVLSYHLTPHTCGVARFNHRLAYELAVPHASWRDMDQYACPLLSVKFAEWPYDDMRELFRRTLGRRYWLFLHDVCHEGRPALVYAERVYAGNDEIADAYREWGIDTIRAWCPSTIVGNITCGLISLLSFGMAHKLLLPRYRRLHELVTAATNNYTMRVSTAVHEGSPWTAVADVDIAMREIFGTHFRGLGFLADDAIVRELRDASAVVMFYQPALRANNTTFWAAVDANAIIVTNLDRYSPIPLVPHRILDIDTLSSWPDLARVPYVRSASGLDHSWTALRELMETSHA